MHEESQWRFEMAVEIAAVFAKVAGIEAIVLGGSVSRNRADRYSDTEVGVFWTDLPSIEQQQQMLASVGGRPRFGRIYPFGDSQPYVPGGGWYSPFLVGQAPGNAPEGGDYPSSESGYPIEMEQDTVAGVETYLSAVVDHWDTSIDKQSLLAFIQTGIPLYGGDLVARWRKKIKVYPRELALKSVRSRLKSLRWNLWQQRILAARDEGPGLYQGVIAIESDLLVVLLALNRVYCPADFHNKWTDRLIDEMEIKPEQLSTRFRQVFGMKPAEGLGHLRSISAETLELVAIYLPEIDSALLDATLRTCWRAWERPPEEWP